MVKPIVGDDTLSELIQQKRLFIADLKILDSVPTKDGVGVNLLNVSLGKCVNSKEMDEWKTHIQ